MIIDLLIDKHHGIESRRQYNQHNGKIIWKGNNTNVTEQDIYDQAAYRFEDIIIKFKIRSVKTNKKGEYSTYLNFTKTLPSTIKEQRHRGFGKCYTYLAPNDTKGLGVYYIMIKLYVNIHTFYLRLKSICNITSKQSIRK